MEIDFSLAEQEERAAWDHAKAEDASKRADDKKIILQQEIELAQKRLEITDELKARYPCEALFSASKAWAETVKTLESSKEVYKEKEQFWFKRAERSAKRVIAVKALQEKHERWRQNFMKKISEERPILNETNDQARYKTPET